MQAEKGKQRETVLIRELPEEERPREKLRRRGLVSLSNGELLAILIGTGTRNMSAVMLADKILALGSGGIGYLADCMPEELEKIPGIGKAKACQLIAAIELGKRIATRPRERCVKAGSSSEVAALFMEEMRYLKKENFKVLMLNTKNEVIMIDEVSVGSLSSSLVHPREVFRGAIKKGAASVILVHNHPSGNPTPSREDIDVTRRLSEAGEIIGIRVLDHLIIGDGEFVSLGETELIESGLRDY